MSILKKKCFIHKKKFYAKSEQVSISKQPSLFIDPIFSEGFAWGPKLLYRSPAERCF